MKVIDLLNKIAKGEEVPHFIIDEQEYYVGADGFLKEIFGDDVEWTLDAQWLNEKVEIIEDEPLKYKTGYKFISSTGEEDEIINVKPSFIAPYFCKRSGQCDEWYIDSCKPIEEDKEIEDTKYMRHFEGNGKCYIESKGHKYYVPYDLLLLIDELTKAVNELRTKM